MTDKRFENAPNDLLSTVFTRTFQNMMPFVFEVLQKMKTTYDRENDTVCTSFGPIDLFKFMNEVYDLSMACLDGLVQKGVLGLIFK